jgi:hypothetical protein
VGRRSNRYGPLAPAAGEGPCGRLALFWPDAPPNLSRLIPDPSQSDGTGGAVIYDGSPSPADGSTTAEVILLGLALLMGADVCLASDSVVCGVTVASADACSTVDSNSANVGVTSAVTDAGASSDSHTIALGAAQADAGTTADANLIASGAVQSDTASSSDVPGASLTVGVSDAAGSTDSNTSSVSAGATNVTVADSAGSVDANTLVWPVASADTSAAADSNTTARGVAAQDASAATDSHTLAQGVVASDAAPTSDSVVAYVGASSVNADTSAAADAATVALSLQQPDAASSADAHTTKLGVLAADSSTTSDSNTTTAGGATLSANVDTCASADANVIGLKVTPLGNAGVPYNDLPTGTQSGGGPITAGAAPGPEGLMDATRVQEGTTGAPFYWGIGGVLQETGQGDIVTYSMWLKYETMQFMDFGRSAYTRAAVIDLINHTITLVDAVLASGVENYGNGWYRYWITQQIPPATYSNVGLIAACRDAANAGIVYTGTGRSYLVYRPRLDRGSYNDPTDYTVGLDARATGASGFPAATKTDLTVAGPETAAATDSTVVAITVRQVDACTTTDRVNMGTIESGADDACAAADFAAASVRGSGKIFHSGFAPWPSANKGGVRGRPGNTGGWLG